MRSRPSAIANDPQAEAVATELLRGGSAAVEAVVGGYFAVAGAYAGVLLSPVSILVAGVGVGARAFDGRVLQPGLGSRRPRGFTTESSAPDAARIGVATGVLAALVAHAQAGSGPLGPLLRPGIAAAKEVGAAARAGLLRRIQEVGAAALREPRFAQPLLRVAGPSEGGLLTNQDLAALPAVDHPAHQRDFSWGALLEVPWVAELSPITPAFGLGCGILAMDAQGVFAALSYRQVTGGVTIEALELTAPRLAIPVLRGVPRVRPGTPLPCPTPIALRRDGATQVTGALAAPDAPTIDAGPAALRLERSTETGKVTATRS